MILIIRGASTLVTSHLVLTCGSNEPEFLLLRARALNQFRRELRAFKLGHGDKVGHTFDERIEGSSLGAKSIVSNPAASMT